MDKGSFDAESSRLQIKKLKEKVKSLVSEVDLSREIRSDEFSKTSKFQLESSINSISSELESSDEDSDEFLDFPGAEFTDETTWLLDRNSNSSVGLESSKDVFNSLYSEVDDYRRDVSDLCCQLQLLRNTSSSSSSESSKSVNRSALIDSRTFTRPKKYGSRPPLTSIVTNSGDEGRQGKLQRRLTTTVSPNPSIIGKLEELSKANNRPVSGVYGDGNWEEGCEEGLADIENATRKKSNNRKSLPASIIDRLQELKRSNNSFACSRPSSEKGRQLNVMNGNVEDPDDGGGGGRRVKTAFDLNVKNALSASCMSDIFKNIPEYFSDDNESFFSLDDISGFYDRLTLSTDPNTYSSIVREMEQNEICFYHSATSLEDVPVNRMTFGGREIPMAIDRKSTEMRSSSEQLLDIDDGDEGDELNKTYEVLNESSASRGNSSSRESLARVSATFVAAPKANATFDAIPKANATYEVLVDERESLSKHGIMNATYDAERKSSLVDVILQSDIIKTISPSYDYKNCDNNKDLINNGDIMGGNVKNNVNENMNETYTQNELNKLHTEKYTTKIFDASFKKTPPTPPPPPSQPSQPNGKKDSDHSEDDCMSTTSDNSYRSVDSNSELKNIEELKNIAMQQNKKLSDVKFSTPSLGGAKPTYARNSNEWPNFSPIRREIGDGESQGSSNASSRGPSPRGSAVMSEGPPKARPFAVRQAPKVPQRELKLKPALLRPTQNFKRMVSNGRSAMDTTAIQKNECRTTASVAGIPVMRPSITPVAPVSSAANAKPKASGIPRPPSRLKPPQIRASEAYKK